MLKKKIIVAIYCLDVSREIVFSTSYRALEFSVTVIFFLQKYFAEKLKKVQLSQRNLFLPLATRMNVQHYVISENLAGRRKVKWKSAFILPSLY